MDENRIWQSLTVSGAKGSKRVKALVDSGATITAISESLADEIGAKITGKEIIETIGEENVPALTGLVKVKIKGRTTPLEVVIIKGCKEMVIGSDFLQKTDGYVDYKEDKLRLP